MSKELKTGIIVSVIIVILIWGLNFLKGKDLLNAGSREFYVEYSNINGLSKASIVTINGFQVGKVDEISFNNSSAEKKGTLLVKISIDNDFQFSKKSVAKIYSAGLMGGQNLAIIPNYEGENAVTGDYLVGKIEAGMFDAFGEKLTPIQYELENVLVGADSLLLGLNQVVDKQSRQSLKRSILGLESTLSGFRQTLGSVNGLLADSKEDLTGTIANAKKITDDFSKLSESLAKTDVDALVKKMETTLTGVNNLLANVEKGNGTLGKLMSDDEMYTNLTNASKEMEELLREMKLNPKRFVHFSLFGKKAKAYNEEKNKENTSNQ